MPTKFIAIAIMVLFSMGLWSEAPQHRDAALMVEAVTVTITTDDGQGLVGGFNDAHNWYSEYDASCVNLGDRMLTVYFYTTMNGEFDEVAAQIDFRL
jgi:hypothetical protein